MKPSEISRGPDGLRIKWADGNASQIKFESIRMTCLCAVCKEMKVPLSPEQAYFKRAVSFQAMVPVGNYALEISWADGHKSIVAFDRLFELSKTSTEASREA